MLAEPASLDQLFTCPHVGRPLTHKACIRRQVERQEAKDGKGRPKEGPPAKPFCASGTCEVGRGIRQEHAALEAWPCPSCGTALLGDAYCTVCAARAKDRGEAKAGPRYAGVYAHQTRTMVGSQEHVWEGKVDLPFIPPTQQKPKPVFNDIPPAPREIEVDDQNVGEELAPAAKSSTPETAEAEPPDRRGGPAAGAPSEVVHPALPSSSEVGKPATLSKQRVAEIAEAVRFNTSLQVSNTLAALAREPEEERMLKDGKKLCTVCNKKPLRSDNRSGICRPCRMTNRGPAAEPAALKPTRTPRKKLSEKDFVLKVAAGLGAFDPAALTDEQLAAAVHEAGRRAQDLRARALRLEELVAEAAPRAVEKAA